ncbi:hypothetical protein APA_241 [Pseudanabaena sp. lw0831]|nr:hypothetical protein APA_241 [Pseudanabaena sp. lw0831]
MHIFFMTRVKGRGAMPTALCAQTRTNNSLKVLLRNTFKELL